MSRTIEYTSIEWVHEAYWYCQHGTYDQSSVLAGEDFRQLVMSYDSIEDARAAHPDALVDLEGYAPEVRELPINPPSWFHPEDAGESWDED